GMTSKPFTPANRGFTLGCTESRPSALRASAGSSSIPGGALNPGGKSRPGATRTLYLPGARPRRPWDIAVKFPFAPVTSPAGGRGAPRGRGRGEVRRAGSERVGTDHLIARDGRDGHPDIEVDRVLDPADAAVGHHHVDPPGVEAAEVTPGGLQDEPGGRGI